jgi:serine/threonine-protein kinase
MLQLGPGERLRFGRSGPDVDFTLSDRAVSRLAGEITVTGDHWSLTNYSQYHTYVVENPEGGGEFVKVPPGRIGAPVPFEISRVVLPARSGAGEASFQVFAPMHTHLDSVRPTGGEPTVAAFPMDITAKYFLVLVALCEPRLRDESPVAIPADADVVGRLRDLPGCDSLTADAVAFHIDYLSRRKLRLRATMPGTAEPGTARVSRREHLVQVALRFDLVRECHLDLLPRRRRPR